MEKDIFWFKTKVAPLLKEYDIEYRYYEEGDFGSLNQALFNSVPKGGEIDFWGLGWLSIHIWDYEQDEELLNVHVGPDQYFEKEQAISEMGRVLNLAL